MVSTPSDGMTDLLDDGINGYLTDADAVMAENGGFAESLPVPEKRAEFFEGLNVIGVDVYKHMSRYIVRKPLSYRIWTRIRSMLSSIKRRVVK